MDKTKKRRIQILAASVFWLGVWQAAAVAIGQEVFLVSPVQAIGTLVELLPQAEFWPVSYTHLTLPTNREV